MKKKKVKKFSISQADRIVLTGMFIFIIVLLGFTTIYQSYQVEKLKEKEIYFNPDKKLSIEEIKEELSKVNFEVWRLNSIKQEYEDNMRILKEKKDYKYEIKGNFIMKLEFNPNDIQIQRRLKNDKKFKTE